MYTNKMTEFGARWCTNEMEASVSSNILDQLVSNGSKIESKMDLLIFCTSIESYTSLGSLIVKFLDLLSSCRVNEIALTPLVLASF